MMDEATQEKLTRVGPGTPMGELLRRYWMPLAATCELPPGAVLPRRHLGEDLVLFRTTAGEPGLLVERCPHRGTSLRHALVDGQGIACAYHGWSFDASGRCLRMPAESADAHLRSTGDTRAYPVQELGGLVFAYLGPRPVPLLPRFDLFVWEGALRDIGQALLPCNWLQIMENSVDPTHVEWLHGQHLGSERARRGLPEPAHYRRHHERIGFDRFRYGIVKRRVLEGGSEADEDWHVGHPLVFPISLRVGACRQHRFQIRVPVDDTHTRHYWYSCYRPAPGSEPIVQGRIPLYEVPWLDEQGRPILDFVDGGDIMVWLGQGAIADRTSERLVASDRGLVLLRQLLLEQLERVAAGEDPLGVVRDERENRIIELPQESDKYAGGSAFLRESIELSHVRYSPIKAQILELLGGA